jgi:hypothetical protein
MKNWRVFFSLEDLRMSSRLMSELDDSTRKLLKPRMEGTGQDRTGQKRGPSSARMEAMELSVKYEAIFSGVFAQTFLFF